MDDNKSENIEINDESFIPCKYYGLFATVYAMPAKELESVTVTKEYCSDARIDIKDVELSFKNNFGLYLADTKYLEPILKYLNSSY